MRNSTAKIAVVILLLLNTQTLMAFCKAESLQRDIEVILSRGDLTIDQRRKDIANAKTAFKEDVIECAVSGQPISGKAAMLAIRYINDDETTKPGAATDHLIKMINSRIPNN